MEGNGFVYSVESNKELTDISRKNISKSHEEYLDDGRIILITGDVKEGLK